MFPHPQLFFALVMLSVAVLVAWTYWMVPLWSRPGIYFAVTVPLPFVDSSEARHILRSYRLRAMVHFAIGAALVAIGSLSEYWALLVIGTIWFIAGPLAAFLSAHKKTMAYAIEGTLVREATLEKRDTPPSGGWIAQLGPFVILIGSALYLLLRWDEIPARFPVHWGIDGRPNGWSTRTPIGVFAPTLLSILIVGGMAAMGYAIRHFARSAPASNSIKYDFGHRVGLFLLIVEYFLAMVFSLVALLPLTGNPGALSILVIAMVMTLSILVLIPWLNKGRGHHAENDPSPLTSVRVGDGTLDRHWKLGMFYFNRDDAALFVEKRFGVGYTLNFAHPSAWICIALVLVIPVVSLLLAAHQH